VFLHAVEMRVSRASAFIVTTSGAPPSSPIAHATVFGWVGARDKHVEKYANLLHALGVPLVMRTTAPTWDCFFAPWRLRRLAEEWLQSLAAPALAGQPGAVLLLSNGGAFVYCEAVKMKAADAALPPAQQRFAHVRLRAALLDSAPARVTARSGSRALTGSIRSPALRAAARWAARALFAALSALWGAAARNAAMWGALTSDGLAERHGYVSSASDDITDAGWVAELVAARLAAGLDTRAWALEASPHCGHLQKEPEKYRAFAEALLHGGAAPGGAPTGGSQKKL
jgi:hypothetical protein